MKRTILFAYVIPLILFVASCIASIIFYDEAYITSLLVHHDPNGSYTVWTDSPLTSGKSIYGEFKAPYDNLGTIRISINTFGRVNNDIIVFQMKQKGSRKWTVYNKYFTDHFIDGSQYPFGFPIIQNSKGKTYEFEITSVNGTNENAIGFKRGYRTLSSQYIYQKSDLIKDKSFFLVFAKAKISTILSDSVLFVYEIIFAVPLIYYYLYFFKVSRKKVIYISFVLLLFVILNYLFLPVQSKPNFVLYIFCIWILFSIHQKLKLKYQFMVGLIILIFIPVSLYFKNYIIANKSAILVFYSFIGSIIIFLKEKIRQSKYIRGKA